MPTLIAIKLYSGIPQWFLQQLSPISEFSQSSLPHIKISDFCRIEERKQCPRDALVSSFTCCLKVPYICVWLCCSPLVQWLMVTFKWNCSLSLLNSQIEPRGTNCTNQITMGTMQFDFGKHIFRILHIQIWLKCVSTCIHKMLPWNGIKVSSSGSLKQVTRGVNWLCLRERA